MVTTPSEKPRKASTLATMAVTPATMCGILGSVATTVIPSKRPRKASIPNAAAERQSATTPTPATAIFL